MSLICIPLIDIINYLKVRLAASDLNDDWVMKSEENESFALTKG